jgi:hypothetical protein
MCEIDMARARICLEVDRRRHTMPGMDIVAVAAALAAFLALYGLIALVDRI